MGAINYFVVQILNYKNSSLRPLSLIVRTLGNVAQYRHLVYIALKTIL